MNSILELENKTVSANEFFDIIDGEFRPYFDCWCIDCLKYSANMYRVSFYMDEEEVAFIDFTSLFPFDMFDWDDEDDFDADEFYDEQQFKILKVYLHK